MFSHSKLKFSVGSNRTSSFSRSRSTGSIPGITDICRRLMRKNDKNPLGRINPMQGLNKKARKETQTKEKGLKNEFGLGILIRELKKNEFGIEIFIKIMFYPKNLDD